MKILFSAFTILIVNLSYCQQFTDLSKTNFNKGDFKDLHRLKSELADVRVVGLGESNHTMGTTFEGKVALFKYLHDSLGFDVIAFESGLYDCKIANDLLDNKEFSSKDFFKALFPIWKCQEVDSLFQFVKGSKEMKNPIDFIGIDNQLLGFAAERLVNDYMVLSDSLKRFSNDTIVTERFIQVLKQEIKYSNYFKKFSIEDTTFLCGKLTKINELIFSNNLDQNEYYKFWLHVNKNIKTDFIRQYFPNGNLRDSMMAENVLDFLKENPTKKIVIWAASYHLMYNIENIAGDDFKNLRTSGEILKKELKDQYYFIGFTPNKGHCGYKEKGIQSFKIKKTTSNSIENFIESNYSSEFGILYMRDTLNQEMMIRNNINRSKLLGRKEREMNLVNMCDAIFYINVMNCPKYYFQ